MKEFNNWLAVKIVKGVSTMWCAYFFAILAIIGFPYGSHSISSYIVWLSQTFIQLTMLSVIMVGQEVINQHHEKAHKKRDEHSKKLNKILKAINK